MPWRSICEATDGHQRRQLFTMLEWRFLGYDKDTPTMAKAGCFARMPAHSGGHRMALNASRWPAPIISSAKCRRSSNVAARPITADLFISFLGRRRSSAMPALAAVLARRPGRISTIMIIRLRYAAMPLPSRFFTLGAGICPRRRMMPFRWLQFRSADFASKSHFDYGHRLHFISRRRRDKASDIG